jgi:hypothetical protein
MSTTAPAAMRYLNDGVSKVSVVVAATMLAQREARIGHGDLAAVGSA